MTARTRQDLVHLVHLGLSDLCATAAITTCERASRLVLLVNLNEHAFVVQGRKFYLRAQDNGFCVVLCEHCRL